MAGSELKCFLKSHVTYYVISGLQISINVIGFSTYYIVTIAPARKEL